MDTKELMIGNWIVYDGKEEQIQCGEQIDCNRGEIIDPIPLTEEWLLKFGFTQQIGYYKLYKGEMFKLGGQTIEVAWNDNNTFYCYVRNFNPHEADDLSTLRNDLKHVHQLQNLYHSLTGEELKTE